MQQIKQNICEWRLFFYWRTRMLDVKVNFKISIWNAHLVSLPKKKLISQDARTLFQELKNKYQLQKVNQNGQDLSYCLSYCCNGNHHTVFLFAFLNCFPQRRSWHHYGVPPSSLDPSRVRQVQREIASLDIPREILEGIFPPEELENYRPRRISSTSSQSSTNSHCSCYTCIRIEQGLSESEGDDDSDDSDLLASYSSSSSM